MFPRIPRHGMLPHQEVVEGCCLCADHWPQANHRQHHRHHEAPPVATETQFLPPIPCYHHPPTYQHPPEHHHHPHPQPQPHPPPQRHVLQRPTRPQDPPPASGHSGDDRRLHRHHHRRHQHQRRSQNRTMVLVKNSDPSYRRSIALHRGAPGSLGLFLEEVSELMRYHVRKLYTSEGQKIDSVQDLLTCPSVLICVGREPSHPAILENLRKTVDEKLPRVNVRLSSTGDAEGQESK
ncbi:Retinitis pigmentosa 1-like 1 protein [Merluccius polli]|uniref:Retinitis pigmentosa 1-like 1 protein n=1 Tax=Merluccius polli TaxID=89951 RepID=A0AA47M8E8_MERPO|nr:Retinitis pigmentosa 1-like 1 protein [Merluccius polli]